MIIRGTPRELDKYILVNGEMSIELHKNGFLPKYIDENGVYYLRSGEVLKFMEKNK